MSVTPSDAGSTDRNKRLLLPLTHKPALHLLQFMHPLFGSRAPAAEAPPMSPRIFFAFFTASSKSLLVSPHRPESEWPNVFFLRGLISLSGNGPSAHFPAHFPGGFEMVH